MRVETLAPSRGNAKAAARIKSVADASTIISDGPVDEGGIGIIP
jgi:hypothetical protein